MLICLKAGTRLTVARNVCPRLKSGKPAFNIFVELLEDLLSLGFTYTRIAQMLVSRWTISRRIRDHGLEDFRSFSKLSDDELARRSSARLYT